MAKSCRVLRPPGRSPTAERRGRCSYAKASNFMTVPSPEASIYTCVTQLGAIHRPAEARPAGHAERRDTKPPQPSTGLCVRAALCARRRCVPRRCSRLARGVGFDSISPSGGVYSPSSRPDRGALSAALRNSLVTAFCKAGEKTLLACLLRKGENPAFFGRTPRPGTAQIGFYCLG